MEKLSIQWITFRLHVSTETSMFLVILMNITDISTQIKSQERKISILNNLNTAIVACATASIGLDIEKTNRLIEKLNNKLLQERQDTLSM